MRADQRACFVHQDWIPAIKGRHLNLVSLRPGAAPCADEMYAINVYTGDARGAGTDLDVSIVLIGDDGIRTSELALDSSRNNFERGRCDEFLVNVKVCVTERCRAGSVLTTLHSIKPDSGAYTCAHLVACLESKSIEIVAERLSEQAFSHQHRLCKQAHSGGQAGRNAGRGLATLARGSDACELRED